MHGGQSNLAENVLGTARLACLGYEQHQTARQRQAGGQEFNLAVCKRIIEIASEEEGRRGDWETVLLPNTPCACMPWQRHSPFL